MILLPEITFYFKKDLFESLHTQKAEPGEDVLFVMQKEEKSGRSLRQMISIRSVFQVWWKIRMRREISVSVSKNV